jgi:hypothetical protein
MKPAGSSVAGSGLRTNRPDGFFSFSSAITQLPLTRPSVLPVAASRWLVA